MKEGLKWVKQLYFTIMLSFYVLIGLHKVPELLLALLCQELTEEEEDEGGSFISCMCIYSVCAYCQCLKLDKICEDVQEDDIV